MVLRETVKQLSQILARYCEELSGRTLIVGVSGGTDSIALLLALSEMVRPPFTRLVAAHFSHGIRLDPEQEEIDLVSKIAEDRDIEVVCGRADVPKLATEMKQSLEDAARESRYSFMAALAIRTNAGAIALGHTQDDQAETVLLHLSRGAGLTGVGGMREWSKRAVIGEVSGVNLLRPFLGVSRSETEEICSELGIAPAFDKSNNDLTFARNRLRHNIFPELAQINPKVKLALSRFAFIAQQDDLALQELSANTPVILSDLQRRTIVWNRIMVRRMNPSLLRRVFQSAWETVSGTGSVLSFQQLHSMVALTHGPSGRSYSLPKGMSFLVDHDVCRLCPTPRQMNIGQESQQVLIPGISLIGDWQITVTDRSWSNGENLFDGDDGLWIELMDADVVGDHLYLRGWIKGDRFQPLGMKQSKKLQDFFVDSKVNKRERSALPVLVAPKGIAAVIGYRVADWASVTPSTKRVLQVLGRKGPNIPPDRF